MKYYVVSDIHGYYDELIKSLDDKGYFNDTSEKKLVILGDFFDRGSQAIKMQEFLVKLIENDEVILIKGNHEELIEEFTNTVYKYFPNLEESHHYRNSTVDTVCQLMNITLDEFKNDPGKYCIKMHDTPLFKIIIPNSIDYFETDKYIFVHGYIPCDVPEYGKNADYAYLNGWRNASLYQWYYARWYNGMKANHDGVKEEGKTIICGHWHSSFGHHYYENDGDEFGDNANYEPYYGDGMICIDGCVPRSKKINCIVLED